MNKNMNVFYDNYLQEYEKLEFRIIRFFKEMGKIGSVISFIKLLSDKGDKNNIAERLNVCRITRNKLLCMSEKDNLIFSNIEQNIKFLIELNSVELEAII